MSSNPEVKVSLYTADVRLKNLLSAAFGSSYEFRSESSLDTVRQLAFDPEVDVVLLDCDTNQAPIGKHLENYGQFIGAATPIIVLTDDSARSTATAFRQLGAFDCIRRPPSLVELRLMIQRAFDHSRVHRDLELAKSESETGRCDRLVGSSGKAQVVYDLIQRVADLSAFVLIRGESGTGKELVARAIHNLGNRADRPFVAVSCGAIPETLIESELFGHEKGAFTGSSGPRAGHFEQASDGTVFLDEIGELSPHTQVKLLRVLQQREFTRLGSSQPIPLKARVLFATHRNLQEMVSTGHFRQDLYFRVNVIEISVPPLRERTEDIPLLARHFLKKYSLEYGKAVRDIRPAAMEALVEYEWPGNIRELENVIQGAVVLADGDSIGRGDLPNHMQLSDDHAIPQTGSGMSSFEQLLREFKVGLALKAVEECNGNKTLAARKLGVSRAYLHRLIRVNSDAPPDEEETVIAS